MASNTGLDGEGARVSVFKFVLFPLPVVASANVSCLPLLDMLDAVDALSVE